MKSVSSISVGSFSAMAWGKSYFPNSERRSSRPLIGFSRNRYSSIAAASNRPRKSLSHTGIRKGPSRHSRTLKDDEHRRSVDLESPAIPWCLIATNNAQDNQAHPPAGELFQCQFRVHSPCRRHRQRRNDEDPKSLVDHWIAVRAQDPPYGIILSNFYTVFYWLLRIICLDRKSFKHYVYAKYMEIRRSYKKEIYDHT